MMSPYSHALSVLVEERVAELVNYRRWFRRLSPTLQAAFRQLASAYRAELVALLRLRRKACAAYRTAEVERTRAIDARIEHVLDYVDAGAGCDDEGYPVNREGDPAWNGALTRW